jgi:hypothetical protein
MNRTILLSVAATLALAACRGSERPADQPVEQALMSDERAAPADLPPDVAHAVAVARAIEANPTRVDSILAAHGLTRAGLDSLMYAIAADSAKAAAYTAALR